MNKHALIFGQNAYTTEIVKNIEDSFDTVHILKLDKNAEYGFDLGDDWESIKDIVLYQESVAFCILENISQNIFLTISLRDTFKDLNIVSLAQDKESADKLMLAGATRAIPTTQSTANTIVEMLEKPTVTRVLHDILYENSSLQIAEIKIREKTMFDGEYPSDIGWSREMGIIVLSIVHEDKTREFIYSSKAKHHIIKGGDIFVVVGYEEDIEEFRRVIGENDE